MDKPRGLPNPGKPLTKQSKTSVATPEMVRHAIETLTEAERAKLYAFANLLAFKTRRYAWGIGSRDLFQEAVLALLEGRRNWEPDRVDLVRFLSEAMRSIASNLKRKGQTTEKPPILESDLITEGPDGEDTTDPLEKIAGSGPSPEETLSSNQSASQLLLQIETLFQGDEIALLVIEAWKDNMKRSDIIADLGIRSDEFDAAAKRIRRTCTAHWPKGMPYV
jgi:DNA-directed RNA polymerase specialized sigma24 family protein